MQFFPNSKTFVAIGPLTIQWYAVLIIIGVAVAYYFSKKDFKENGYSQETLDDLLIGCLLTGIICARLWFCLFWDAEYYFSDISHLLDIRGGGLAIQGGLLGGALFGLFYAKKHKMNFLRGADVVATNILVSQAIGRWGNFMNQEAYGQVVSEAFYNNFPSFIKDKMFIDGAYRQPTFLWESVLDLIGFMMLRFLYRKHGNPKRGDMTCLYLVWYGVSRFIVESFRTDNLMFMGMKMSRVMSLLFVVVGVVGFILIRVKKNNDKPIVLFDLDGTLLDTTPAIIQTYAYLFKKYDKVENFDEAKQLEVLGPSLDVMFKKYFPHEDVDKLMDEYRDYNLAIHKDVVKPMPNCEALLKTLKEKGYKMGVVSTKKSFAVKFGLDLFNLSDYFEVIIGKDDVTNTKPDPEGIFKACSSMNLGHDSVVYIGDSATDIEASIRAGVYAVGYVSDLRRKDKLVNAKPNVVIDDLQQLETILQEDHSWTYNMM